MLSTLIEAAVGDCGFAHDGNATYPSCTGKYHYDDTTCDYNCMSTEFMYWALTSYLGAQDNNVETKRCADDRRLGVSNGEEFCEESGFSESECTGHSGCCEWDDGSCWSTVGDSACSTDNDGSIDNYGGEEEPCSNWETETVSRCNSIANEWELCTKTSLETLAPDLV